MVDTIKSNRTKTLKEADLKDIFDELMLRFHVESISIEEEPFIHCDGTSDFLIRIQNGYYCKTEKGDNNERMAT